MLTDKERRAIMKDDPSTYLGHTHNETGGRFAKAIPNNVIGSSPISYPTLKSGPWSPQPGPGPEPPFGEDISTPPIVGEHHEVEASLDRDFGVARNLRDGAPPSPGRLIPAALEPAPDSEVVRGAAEEPAPRQPLPLSGRGQSSPQIVSSPSKSKPLLRRLR
jgi:hypothetical protein